LLLLRLLHHSGRFEVVEPQALESVEVKAKPYSDQVLPPEVWAVSS